MIALCLRTRAPSIELPYTPGTIFLVGAGNFSLGRHGTCLVIVWVVQVSQVLETTDWSTIRHYVRGVQSLRQLEDVPSSHVCLSCCI